MRGTLLRPVFFCVTGRIIPAHAGNSVVGPESATEITDHPRACGELLAKLGPTAHIAGSSPRMRGTLDLIGKEHRVARIIPAHAGNSPPQRRRSIAPTDHPRACGELVEGAVIQSADGGSSPRMRGTRRASAPVSSGRRIIPAHAGNSCFRRTLSRRQPDHPRACGELPAVSERMREDHGSSPRMRGTRPARR